MMDRSFPDAGLLSDAISDGVETAIRRTAATEVRPRFRSLGKDDIRQKKGPNDLVTVADEAAERSLRAALTALIPGSVTVGEEEAEVDPGVLDRLYDSAPVWVIDPIDGTLNYARGSERYAMMVALVAGTQTLGGWIYLPEDDVMAVGRLGGGTTINGRPPRFSRDPGALSGLHGLFGIPDAEGPKRTMGLRLAAVIGSRTRVSCAGADYIDLVEGVSHIAAFNRLKPWDHAPGVLMLDELGAVSAEIDTGDHYRPVPMAGPMLIAPNQRLWDEAVAAIKGDVAPR